MISTHVGSTEASMRALGVRLMLLTIPVVISPSVVAAQTSSMCRTEVKLRLSDASVMLGGRLDSPVDQVGHAAVDEDGHLLVTDRASEHVVRIDPEGSVVGRFGGKGEGPGEFESLFHVGVRHDTIWASDRMLGRITLFSSAGEVLETVDGRTVYQDPRLGHVGPVALSADRQPVGVPGLAMPMAARNSVIEWPVLTTDSSGAYTDTLATVSRAHNHVLMEDLFGEGSTTAMHNPFGAHDVYAVSPDGNQIFIAEQVENGELRDTIRVMSITLGGDTTTVYRSNHGTPVQLDEGVVQDSLEQIAAGYHMGAQAAGWSTPEAAILEGIREQFDPPEHVPPVVELVSTLSGHVFLELWSSDSSESAWCVLTESGSEVGVLKIDGGGDVIDLVGSSLWVVRKIEYDLEQIVKYQLSAG